jgi:lysophospholipase L1-like esterase
MQKIALMFFSLLFMQSLIANENSVETRNFIFKGRTEKTSNESGYLISSASSVTSSFKGKTTSYFLSTNDSFEHDNYFVVEVDGQYKGRFIVKPGKPQEFFVKATTSKVHLVTIYKATEAANGNLFFDGSKTKNIVPTTIENKKRIEFIGDSITCGMGNDMEIPCHTNNWFDQHNAYLAYGPVLSRKLDVDYLLSSISGNGMYRNWNSENSEETILPDVYNNLYQTKDATKPFPTDFQPNLVSICLGTNDLSDGDGTKPRLPFNKGKYVSNYIEFIKNLYNRYPNTRIVLLNSPMVSGEKNTLLVSCLKEVIAAFKDDKNHKPIALFEFDEMKPKGCDYHPDGEDHKIIAAQMEDYFKQLLNE